jgi:hypothetical protein
LNFEGMREMCLWGEIEMTKWAGPLCLGEDSIITRKNFERKKSEYLIVGGMLEKFVLIYSRDNPLRALIHAPQSIIF